MVVKFGAVSVRLHGPILERDGRGEGLPVDAAERDGEVRLADVEADGEEKVVLAEVHVPFVRPDLREAGIEIEVGAAFGAAQEIVVLERAAEVDEQRAVAAEGADVTFFQTEHLPVVVKDRPILTETELIALLLECVDHVRDRAAGAFLRRAEDIEPEDVEAQRAQAGEIMEIEPLQAAALGIARAPCAGDDDLIHGRRLCGAGELEFADVGVVPAAGDQIGVASALDDLAVVHDQQQVRLTDS